MFNNWCWAHWITLVSIIISVPATALNQYVASGNIKKALVTFAIASIIAVIETYVLHVGGFW